MTSSLSVEEKYSLVTRRLELQNGWAGEKLHQLILGGKIIKYQWATTPTGKREYNIQTSAFKTFT